LQKGSLIASKQKVVVWEPRLIGHVDLARDQPIEFGGEIAFGSSYNARGKLRWWNDQTGHYSDPLRPMNPQVVTQLPIEMFRRAFP